MDIVSCFKVVPNEEDIVVTASRDLSFEYAKPTVSSFDFCCIEAGAQIVEANGGSYSCLSVGGQKINDSKMRKSVLARGPQSLYLLADDNFDELDTHQTAVALKKALEKIGKFDLVLCGDGSSDIYAQQVGPQLGQLLGLPCLNGVSKIIIDGERVIVERSLENEIESVEITLPAVLSVTSDMNIPRIPSMKDILAAGKRPVTVWTAEDVTTVGMEKTIEVLEIKAPKMKERKQINVVGDSEDAIRQFIANISAVL